MHSTKMKSSKKFTSIQVFDDEEVVQHILPHDEELYEGNKHGRKSKTKPELEYKLNTRKPGHEESENVFDEEMVENAERASARPMEINDPDCLYGSEVFKFKTPKKAGQMALKAQIAASPLNDISSPDRKKTALPAAVKRTRSCKSKSGPLTPIPQRLMNGPAQREHPRAELSTPYRLRMRNLATTHEGDVSASEDSIDESSEEEEEETDRGNEENSLGSGVKSKGPDLVASAEAYFDIHSMNQVTSDRTLANLDTPRMDIQEICQVLKKVKASHVTETSSLLEKHKLLFDRWMLNMCQGYNILTYGVGSKLSLLDSFRQSHLKPFSHLVVNGYFPSLTVKHILNSITEEILEESKSFTNLFAHIEFIDHYLKTNEEDMYLVIHNIDGILLRSQKCQNILSLLASIEGIHLIASVDHINASFLWDEIQFFRFHWVWYETSTFLNYEAENSYENSLMVQQSGGLALSSIIHVMRSLTPNAKRIFLLLAEYQLKTSTAGSNYEGMSFQALYQQCREDFLVNSDLTLQAQLVEFKDHRLIRAKKNFEGIEHLVIPIDKSTLKVFLDEHRDGKS